MTPGSGRWERIKGSLTAAQWRRAAGLAAVIVGLHVIGFGLLSGFVVPAHLSLGASGAFGIGVGITAYTLGMRHAFDADHIRAIGQHHAQLFAAGMCLLDTIDGAFMNFAYGWAFSRPVRKVFCNITITGLSVAVALVVGTIELLSAFADKLGLTGGLWGWVSNLDLNYVGYAIVGLFVITWAIALEVWHFASRSAGRRICTRRIRRAPCLTPEQAWNPLRALATRVADKRPSAVPANWPERLGATPRRGFACPGASSRTVA